jgi:inulin fructotransferase (DFA-I-forming)
MDVDVKSNDSAFEGQVDALLTTEDSGGLDVITVMVDAAATRNTVLDSGREDQVIADEAVNAVRPTPSIGRKPTPPTRVARRGGPAMVRRDDP